jgi:hypothetical protein
LSKAATDPQPGNMTMHCPHTGKVSKSAYGDDSATGPCK